MEKISGDKLETTGHLQRVQLNDSKGRAAVREGKEEQDNMPTGIQVRTESQRFVFGY